MAELWTRGLRWLIYSLLGFLTLLPVMASTHQSETQTGTQSILAVQLQPVITTGLSSPVFVTSARDGSNRLFIVEQPGRIKVLQPGQTSPAVFLDIVMRVLSGGEQGLLGLALHPQFKFNGRFFVYYTRQTDGAITIAEYHTSATNPNVADTTEKPILSIPHPTFANHNGGMMAFGPDGFLYFGTGDGGSGNDPGNNAQNTTALLGKILRIDVDHPNGPSAYSSPATNPFVGVAGADEIFAYGMRNPWRWSFDRSTGQLYVGDVGQNNWEEVDIITNGGNFGWRVMEGNHCNPAFNGGTCTPIGIAPIAEYSHTSGRCSITGGYVYRGPIATLPTGSYVYADFCTGEIFLLDNGMQSLLMDTTLSISSFGEDEAGEIYVVNLGGSIHRLVNTTAPCSFSILPSSQLFRATGGTGSVAVTTPLNCVWTAVSNDSFIIISAGANGTGVGAVNYTVAPNPGAMRTGTLTVAGQTFTVTQAEKENLFDFDGEGKTDLAVWRPSAAAEWLITNSSDGSLKTQPLGAIGDSPVPGDYDGDWKTDVAVWRPSTGLWTILNSSNSTQTNVTWGVNGDVPVPADYDGDGKTDVAVWRPSTHNWHIRNSSDGSISTVNWGTNGDVVVPADYDGDGKTDIAAWRPSSGTWYIINSSNSSVTVTGWGTSGDVPVPGDYDGDGKADVAMWRPSNGTWYIINSSNSLVSVVGWGVSSDEPLTGDFDGDTRTDVAVWRPSTATWYIINSSSGLTRMQAFGNNGDVPAPSTLIR